MGYKTEVLLLGANDYNFTDESTGKKITGTSLHLVDMSNVSQYGVGFVPTKLTADYEIFQSLQNTELPAYAEIEILPSLQKNKAPRVIAVEVLEPIRA